MRDMADQFVSSIVQRKSLIRDVLLVVGGSLFVAICAKIQAPGPVPFTMQTFAVCLVAATLGARRGAAAMIAYLLEGMAGLPVFALPAAGPAYFAGPTTGYLLGFVFAAWAMGAMAERGWDRHFLTACITFILGHGIILSAGWLWLTLAQPLDATQALSAGVVVHVPSAVLKSALAAVALPAAWRLTSRAAVRPE